MFKGKECIHVTMLFIGNLDIFRFISPSDIVSYYKVTLILEIIG